MIVNPIIPIWLMIIICVILIIMIVKDWYKRKKIDVNIILKFIIINLLFIINLRIMIPNGEINIVNQDLNIMFVIDKSVSMRALDYDGNKERFEGVINDCCYIIEKMSGCKFSIITFGDTAERLIPFTTDSDMVQAELKSIQIENDMYANGTSINLVNEKLEKILKKEKNDANSKYILFFITDGEITKEGENLKPFTNIKQYVTDGAVLGYGTTTGGKMVYSLFEDYSEDYEYKYLYYYDKDYKRETAISKIDENNLKQISKDIGIDYIHMSETNNINYKINDIYNLLNDSTSSESKTTSYKDTYYMFAIPLVIIYIIKFAIIKKTINNIQ